MYMYVWYVGISSTHCWTRRPALRERQRENIHVQMPTNATEERADMCDVLASNPCCTADAQAFGAGHNTRGIYSYYEERCRWCGADWH